MRYLILSDVHANLEALLAVLEAVDADGFDAILVLGDLVGYGASPNETVEVVRGLSRPLSIVRGNHDKAAVGIDDATQFHRVARFASIWTGNRLTADNRRYLEGLPRGPLQVDRRVSICHGSPRDEDEYLLSNEVADAALADATSQVTFFGHSHLPGFFVRRDQGVESAWVGPGPVDLDLDPEASYLLNPGSVGQPRDGNSQASFMTYDGDAGRAHWQRTPYAIAVAQQKILDAGLPSVLAHRLSRGT